MCSFAVYWRACDSPFNGGWWGSELCVHTACTPENFHQCLSADWGHATVKEGGPGPPQNQWVVFFLVFKLDTCFVGVCHQVLSETPIPNFENHIVS